MPTEKDLLKIVKKGRVVTLDCMQPKCDLISHCPQTPFEYIGKPKSLILMPNGGDLEFNLNRPFTSTPGMSVRNILMHLGIKKDYALGYLCRCSRAKGADSLSASDYTTCKPHIDSFVKKFKIDSLVLMGAVVIKNFFPDIKNVSRHLGEIRKLNIGGRTVKCLLTSNPSQGIKNPDRLGVIYQNMFNFFISPMPQLTVNYAAAPVGSGVPGVKYEILTTVKSVKRVLAKMFKKSNPVVFDIEATSLMKFHTDILTLQFYDGSHTGYCIPWKHPESLFSKKDLNKLVKVLKKFFSRESKIPFFIGHNLKYDFTEMLTCEGIDITKRLWDTMCGSYLLDETKTTDESEDNSRGAMGGYDLASQVIRYGYKDQWYFAAKMNNAYLKDEPLEDVAKYGVGDVVLNYGVFKCQLEEAKQQGYYRQFKNMLLHFYSHQIKLFADMEIAGVKIDQAYLKLLTSKEKSPLLKYIEKLKKELYTLPNVIEANARLSVNHQSIFDDLWLFDLSKMDHKQLLFFDVMGLEPISFGKPPKGKEKGLPSLDKKFQKAYKKQHREVEIFALLQRANQLYNLYAKSFNKIFHQNPDCEDGRIRPSFFGTRTRTGRGSSGNPNLQQTVREDGTELVDIVRKLFTSEFNNCIVKLDIMANEVRVWGSVSKDTALKAVVENGRKMRDKYFFRKKPSKKIFKRIKKKGDLHRGFASQFNTVPIDKVTGEQRQASKNTTFGTMFGLSDENLALSLGKTIDETKEIKRVFFKVLNKGKRWIDRTQKFGRENLYAESMMGRRRRLWHHLVMYPLTLESTMMNPKLQTYNGRIRGIHSSGDRRAVNSPIQSLGSDISYMGTIFINWYKRRFNKNWKVMNVVHDSTEAEIPISDLREYVLVSKLAYETMVAAYLEKYFKIKLFVPVEIDFEAGPDFSHMVKWDGNAASIDDIQKKVIKLDKERQEKLAA